MNKKRHKVSLSLVLIIAMALSIFYSPSVPPEVQAAGWMDVTPDDLVIGTDVDGSVTYSDYQDKDGYYYHIYKFNMSRDDDLKIQVESFDETIFNSRYTYFCIYDGANPDKNYLKWRPDDATYSSAYGIYRDQTTVDKKLSRGDYYLIIKCNDDDVIFGSTSFRFKLSYYSDTVATPTPARTSTPTESPTEAPQTDISQAATGELSSDSWEYDPDGVRPYVSVFLKGTETYLEEDEDYSLYYEDNYNIGTGYAVIYGIGNYTGEIRLPFKITRCKITYAGSDTRTCTGKKIKPKIYYGSTLLQKGTDYSIKYKTNFKSVGLHKAIITYRGNYTGKATYKLKIVPGTPKRIRLKKRTTGYIRIAWKKGKGSSYTKVEYYDSKHSKWRTKNVKGSSTTIHNKSTNPYMDVRLYGAKKKKGKKYIGNYKYYANVTKPKRPKIRVEHYGVYGLRVTVTSCNASGYYKYERALKKSMAYCHSEFYSLYKGGATINDTYEDYSDYLYGGTKVWVRVRQQITFNDHTYVSAWSKKKHIKV